MFATWLFGWPHRIPSWKAMLPPRRSISRWCHTPQPNVDCMTPTPNEVAEDEFCFQTRFWVMHSWTNETLSCARGWGYNGKTLSLPWQNFLRSRETLIINTQAKKDIKQLQIVASAKQKQMARDYLRDGLRQPRRGSLRKWHSSWELKDETEPAMERGRAAGTASAKALGW
jgi:hypothetical protein